MGSTAVNLPTIHLDTTLTDLYKLADPSTAHLSLGLVLCGVNSALALTPSFPRNKKYLYQDSPFNNIPPAELKHAAASLAKTTDLQRSIALKYLSLIPQRDAFITGGPHTTTTIFFNVSPGTASQEAHDRHEAEATMAVLSPEQRPKLVFCSGPAEIPVKELGIERLAVKIMLDDLERKGYPLVVDQETQWFLNSKAGLAKSGLPTPRAEVIDVEGFLPPMADGECCGVCRAEDDLAVKGGMRFVPAGCRGARGRWAGEQMKRIVEKVDARQAPFVFKTQQTFGGAGTWVVSDEKQKRELVEKLMDDETGVLRKLLSQVTAKNQHMKPGSVVLSEMVRDPVGDYGVTFMVGKGGEATFLAASEQIINEDNAWIGSTINYARQESLKEKFEGIMRQTAKWVGEHGYIGPVGIDILETKDIPKDEHLHKSGISSADGERTAHYIVDLNVRTSGSLALPLLKGHFTSRGMTCASSFSTTLQGSRKEFIETWKEEFETGRMLIMAWYEDHTGNGEKEVESIGDVVVGGKDEKDLQGLMKRVRESTEEVTF